MNDDRRPLLPPFATDLLKRVGQSLITLWLVSMVTFALLFLAPLLGRKDAKISPADMMAMTIAGAHTDPETIANIKHDRGLDLPYPVQYGLFVRDAVHGLFVPNAPTHNLVSYRNGDRVFAAIWRRFPNSLILAVVALCIYLGVAIPLGSLTAETAEGVVDRGALLISIIAISIPTFWLGRLLQYYIGYRGGWLGVGGSANLWNLPLPALTLGIGGAAYYSRLLHANLRGVLAQDYIRAARARGLSEPLVLVKHALKNALIPLVTILGLDFASLLSGLIFTEKIFGWPGIGSLAIDSVLNQDTPMIMGTVLFSAFAVVVMNILIDVAYHIIDPRVRVVQS